MLTFMYRNCNIVISQQNKIAYSSCYNIDNIAYWLVIISLFMTVLLE